MTTPFEPIIQRIEAAVAAGHLTPEAGSALLHEVAQQATATAIAPEAPAAAAAPTGPPRVAQVTNSETELIVSALKRQGLTSDQALATLTQTPAMQLAAIAEAERARVTARMQQESDAAFWSSTEGMTIRATERRAAEDAQAERLALADENLVALHGFRADDLAALPRALRLKVGLGVVEDQTPPQPHGIPSNMIRKERASTAEIAILNESGRSS